MQKPPLVIALMAAFCLQASGASSPQLFCCHSRMMAKSWRGTVTRHLGHVAELSASVLSNAARTFLANQKAVFRMETASRLANVTGIRLPEGVYDQLLALPPCNSSVRHFTALLGLPLADPEHLTTVAMMWLKADCIRKTDLRRSLALLDQFHQLSSSDLGALSPEGEWCVANVASLVAKKVASLAAHLSVTDRIVTQMLSLVTGTTVATSGWGPEPKKDIEDGLAYTWTDSLRRLNESGSCSRSQKEMTPASETPTFSILVMASSSSTGATAGPFVATSQAPLTPKSTRPTPSPN